MIKKPNHSFSFLMEFLIILFFFAISAVVCVRIFSSSVHVNYQANQTKEALEIAQNYIESVERVECGKIQFEDGYEGIVEWNQNEYPHYELRMYQNDIELISISFYGGVDCEKN